RARMVYPARALTPPIERANIADSDESTALLGIPGFTWADLRSPARLADLFACWDGELLAADPSLHARYSAWRAGAEPKAIELSSLLVELAPHVSAFVARLFRITDVCQAERERTRRELAVLRFKDEFVKRRALKRKVAPGDAAAAQARGA